MATLGESPNGLSAATRLAGGEQDLVESSSGLMAATRGLARAVAELQRCRG